MNTFAQKSRGSRSRAVANKESNVHQSPQLVDQRPTAITQRALAESFNQSTKVQSQLQLQQMFDQSPRVAAQMKLAEVLSGREGALPTRQTIQREEALEDQELTQRQPSLEEEEPLQEKSMALQREDVLEDEEPLQGKFEPLQRAIMPEDEEPLQSKAEPIQKKENRTGLPDKLKAGVENLSGLSMDDVRVHYNSSAPATVQALAYTQGSEIHVGPGQEQHLAHEAWHVAQQKQGRVQPTLQMKGVAINDDAELENEADVMGARVSQLSQASPQAREASSLRSGETESGPTSLPVNSTANGAVAQCKWLATGGKKDLYWDKVVDGLQWFYNTDREVFYYRIVRDDDVPYEWWKMVEANEGERLTEGQLDRLGFEEMALQEGEDRIEYRAPEPEFADVDESMVTMLGERELVEMLRKHLRAQTVMRNYDRLLYVNAFLNFLERNPQMTQEEALARFDISSTDLVSCAMGGHCGGLSGDLLKEGGYGKGAYLVGSELPADYQQEQAPKYCHVAAMIRFQSPETAEDNGLIILEPGFNITEPIVVKKGKVTPLEMETEIWDFYLNEEMTEVICQPRPKNEKEKWKEKKKRDKRMIYRTDQFLNPDLSLTVPLLRVDGRPQILARDEKGAVVAVIAINYKKRVIEFRIGKTRYPPVNFSDVDKDGKWLGDAAGPLAELLHMSVPELISRIYQAVTKHW